MILLFLRGRSSATKSIIQRDIIRSKANRGPNLLFAEARTQLSDARGGVRYSRSNVDPTIERRAGQVPPLLARANSWTFFFLINSILYHVRPQRLLYATSPVSFDAFICLDYIAIDTQRLCFWNLFFVRFSVAVFFKWIAVFQKIAVKILRNKIWVLYPKVSKWNFHFSLLMVRQVSHKEWNKS